MDAEARRQELYGLMGDLPDRDRPIGVDKISEEAREFYILETLVLDLNGEERVPAFFTRPRVDHDPAPAVLYNHAHGGDYRIGRREFIEGRRGLRSPPYAEFLARLGCCGLCIDHWAFNERGTREESLIFKRMLWKGQVMWGMMVYDSLRALDYLCSREEVDASRIGTCGISMGSTMAWWVAALDTRVKVTVDLCCLTDFHALMERNALDFHGIYYYVPGLLKRFDAAGINELIAPRPRLSCNGVYDRLTPPEGLDRIDERLRKAYADAGAADAWRLERYEHAHFECAAMRRDVAEFLKRWL